MRIVKPELWTDKITGSWPADVRDLFIALIVQADDHGRFEVDEVVIRAAVYPRRQEITDEEVRRLIGRMVTDGRVAVYDIEDRRYLVVLRFYKHQRPQRRFAPKYPAPPPLVLDEITRLNGQYCPPEHTRVCAMAHTPRIRGLGDGGWEREEKGGVGGSEADAAARLGVMPPSPPREVLGRSKKHPPGACADPMCCEQPAAPKSARA